MLWIALTAGSLAIVLLSEHLAKKGIEWIFKPLASTGFIGLSLESGALESDVGSIFLCALVLSWIGDVLLIPRTPKPSQEVLRLQAPSVLVQSGGSSPARVPRCGVSFVARRSRSTKRAHEGNK